MGPVLSWEDRILITTRIKEQIAMEDHEQPFSDRAICDKLRDRFPAISPGTIAWYRMRAGIEGSGARRTEYARVAANVEAIKSEHRVTRKRRVMKCQ